MTIEDMHYDFKQKLNKIDSAQNRNFIVPEIDWILNEAQELFIKMIVEPRFRKKFSFEIGQRNIDDVKILVKDKLIPVNNNTVTLPQDYMYFLNGLITAKKQGKTKFIIFHVRQHDDEFENSEFDKSSFEWETINGVFNSKGIILYDDGTFTNESFNLSYIAYPKRIHNAENYKNQQYTLPSGENLTGKQHCILPENTHREIVDIAVLITSGQIQAADYKLKNDKLTLNNLR